MARGRTHKTKAKAKAPSRRGGKVKSRRGGKVKPRRGGKVKPVRGSKAKPVRGEALFRKALAALDRQARAREAKVREELKRLNHIIRTTKADIAAIRPDEVKQEFIAAATGELDAIVEGTAEATNAIMDATEKIERVMGALQGENANLLMEATSSIYEACGFQDITGQRISKVVKAIKQIEERIDVLNAVFGDQGAAGSAAGKKAADKPSARDAAKPVTDEDLLNGPQLKSKAKTQEEIDAMLFGSGR